jgi:hypothetical protein
MHTELDNIERLLEKYLEATTTLQEEALLKTYFTSDNVAPHLQEYQGMFHYFSSNKKERFTKSIRLETNNKKRKWIGLAASIALLIGGGSINSYQENKQAQKAYADTQHALSIIAKQMNKGTVAIGHLNTFDDTKQKVFK